MADYSLEVVYGEIEHRERIAALVGELQASKATGTLYVGYPVLTGADSKIFVDALLVSENFGLIAFDTNSTIDRKGNELLNADDLKEKQNNLYALIANKLNAYPSLRKGRKLGVNITVITYHANAPLLIWEEDFGLVPQGRLGDVINKSGPINADLLRPLNAAIQRISTLRPVKKRETVSNPTSKGGRLKQIERAIANLDTWQKQAAIEFVEGPQRIRGLAGSGKTIVLALKAAYLHARHPEWKIAVTFNTLSLHQQFRDLIRRFCYDQIGDEPDWTKVSVIHAWGGERRPGVYSHACGVMAIQPLDFATAASRFGRSRAFQGACEQFLAESEGAPVNALFDAILIDEAQDLPSSFFQLAYLITSNPKRLVWAYDDLQNLGDYEMPSADLLFGTSPDGQPRVRIQNRPGEPRQDIVLPVCYRNTPWALTAAHALGFGVYRAEGLVQMFDDPNLWLRIGYQLEEGQLELGASVRLKRRVDSFPSYFSELLSPSESITFRVFANEQSQFASVAENIKNDLHTQEVERTDFLIVLPEVRTSRTVGASMVKALRNVGLHGHLVGITSSRDEVFQKDSIAITHIFRAKGNEAPIVYVLNADYCHGGLELAKKRNALFTAMTRSRAWLNVYGVGDSMSKLEAEYNRIVLEQYELAFKYPTVDQVKRLARVHRERTDEERTDLERQVEAATDLLRKVREGELPMEALPEDLRDMINLSQ